MAEPQDSATIVFEDLSAGIMTQYKPGVTSQFERFGHVTDQLFQRIPNERLTGKDFEVTLEHRIQTNARVNNDIFAALPASNLRYALDTYTISIDETAADNDLHRIAAAVRVSHPDIVRAENNPHEKARLVRKLITETMEDVAESRAWHRQADANSTLATIEGDPVQNDDFEYANGTAHTNQTSVRAKVSSALIGAIKEGMLVDIRNSGGADYATNGENLTVIDVNVADYSIGLSGSADLAAITDGDTLHRSDEYGNGINSLGVWFAGETTIFGKDRSTAGNRYLIPTRINANSGAWDKTYFDRMALAMGYIKRNTKRPWLMTTTPELWRDVFNSIDEKSVIQQTMSAGESREAVVGGTDIIFKDPMLGTVRLTVDPFNPSGKIRLLNPETWFSLYGIKRDFMWFPGSIGSSNFYRLTDADGNPTYMYQADGYLTMCDYTTAPRMNAEIYGLAQSYN